MTFETLEDRTLLSVTPVLLGDLNPGAASSTPEEFVEIGGTTFFAANDGTGTDLWKTDGTPVGTENISSPYGEFDAVQELTNVYGTLFFRGHIPNFGNGLWKSDGTEAGTELIGTFSPLYDADAREFTAVDGTLFFTMYHPVVGRELWKTDGTLAGTDIVKDINPGSDDAQPQWLRNVNGTLFFTANDGTHGWELWKSDGTEAGTVMVKDITAHPFAVGPQRLTDAGGTVFFVATGGHQLWKSDGTEAGTVPVTNGIGDIPFQVNHLTDVNGTLFFSTSIPFSEPGLWKTDGTPAGTVLVKDINPGSGMGVGVPWTDIDGTLFFTAEVTSDDGTLEGFELWKSDGSVAGTMRVKGFSPRYDSSGEPDGRSSPDYLTNVDGRLFFAAYDTTHGYELWTSDGTATVRVTDINPGIGDSFLGWSVEPLLSVNGKLYLPASNGSSGFEPWTLDTNALFRNTEIDVGLGRGSINVNSNGVIAVSILTTADFDATRVDVSSVDFAGASAFQSALEDIDGDGDLDLLLHFRTDDTMLRSIYEQLVAEDLDGDGVLGSRNQVAEVAVAGLTLDDELFEGFDSLNLSLSGRALRELLDELFAAGSI